MDDLMDGDGENLALRMFLAYYGGSCGIKVGNMKDHLRMAGFDGAWPAWCNEPGEDGKHLTKGGTQLWIRHLFSLEPKQVSEGRTTEDVKKLFSQVENELGLLAAKMGIFNHHATKSLIGVVSGFKDSLK